MTLQRRKDEASCRLQLLLQKQGRDGQFSSAEERDRWILNEIKQLQTSLEENSKTTTTLNRNAKQQRKDLKKCALLNIIFDTLCSEFNNKSALWKKRRRS